MPVAASLDVEATGQVGLFEEPERGSQGNALSLLASEYRSHLHLFLCLAPLHRTPLPPPILLPTALLGHKTALFQGPSLTLSNQC